MDEAREVCPELEEWMQKQSTEAPPLASYLAHGSVSLPTYVRSQKLELGRTVSERHRIYLDMRYWIDCERGRYEPVKYQTEAELYRVLLRLVRSGKAICPLAYPVFAEAMQGSATSRDRLATVVDELSCGVTLEPPDQLLRLELLHWVRTVPGLERPIHPIIHMAWNSAGHLSGIMLPHGTPFDQATELAIQKSFFDKLGRIPFSLMVKQLSFAGERPMVDYTEFAAHATREQERHRGDFKTFREVFAIEIAGVAESYKEELGQIMAEMYRADAPDGELPMDKEVRKAGNMLANLLHIAFTEGKLRQELPFAYIGAGLHALVRYGGGKVGKGDIHDFMHARTALPYCNYFLTEKRLGNLLTNKLLGCDTLYGCRVLWKTQEIIDQLKRLSGAP